MITPPSTYRNNHAALKNFLVALGEASNAPLILQNAPPPLGPDLSALQVAQLMRDLPVVAYVKEECLPAGQRISSHLANASADLRGVFGGAAGRFVMDELARGAIGTMPSCEIPEEHVALMKAFRAGDVASARRVYNRMVPLLLFTSVFKAAGVKSVLRMRGVIHSELCRDPASGLDEMDHCELHAILEGLGIEVAATMNEGRNAHLERSAP
jgi:4-hydroxy-tetrahydrodipicolinate synthase